MIRALLTVVSLCVAGAAAGAPAPRVAIIIDDIGYRWQDAQTVLDLPRQIAVAVIPGSPHGTRVAAHAAKQRREVLLHLPMQALQDVTGAGRTTEHGLQVNTSDHDLRQYLAQSLQKVPEAIGINNHRGSRLTQDTGSMRGLMRALACHRNLYFIDSYTTADSVALAEAQRALVPATRRHVFLDNDPNPQAVDAQIERLISLAHRRGFAVAIGHPRPATLAALQMLPERLDALGITLVAPGELVSIPPVTADASAD